MNEDFESLKKITDILVKVKNYVKDLSIDYIKKSFDEVGTDIFHISAIGECTGYGTFIAYDGDTHPENNNLYSSVIAVRKTRDGHILVESEDTEIDIIECTVDECYDIAFIINLYREDKPKIDEIIGEEFADVRKEEDK